MNWLAYYMKRADPPINQNQLAKAANTDRQQIGKLLRRPDIPKKWADRLAPFLKVTPEDLMIGPERLAIIDQEKRLALVVGETAAGVWREQELWDSERYPPVPYTPKVFAGLTQTAYRVTGPSMEKLRIFDGDFVLTVPYWEVRTAPQADDVVIVERRKGHLIETTCKQIALGASGVELWPRSHDPRYQIPLLLPANHAASEEAGEVIEITALVVGRFGFIGQ